MKKRTLFSTLLLASSLTFTGFSATVNAEDGAKTVYGENLPNSADTNGDGWANVDFNTSSLPQSAENQISELSKQKDSGELTQIEYNEKVSSIFNEYQSQSADIQSDERTQQGERPFGGVIPNGMTQEEYQELESNVPNPNSVSTEKYNQIVENESQKIANEENKTINTPQGEFTPVTENTNKNSEEVKSKDSNSQVLPETGESNQSYILSIIGASGLLILGIGLLLFRKKLT
ncbi:LPXTG cell wall anchor domain-containing protein [Staphylococcus saprophyticus]|uniref:LPXTG cell wall anchor domain-containing protein n=1 Tax=Staphylococcus saprophyticus TaxID=29385 RepID=UPI00085314CA|nr:LPXTG cell wall anchor domain-containing protein [Staphylococcus saprophyticus]OEK23350.1 peptidase [Staphylococcus saprophyticus]OEK75099.1 peptidase [Staphylococcus saprophyticus]QKV12706.1 LPXTG cell wall anchor domain-containing protein [Staphylococcus saprophyticus]